MPFKMQCSDSNRHCNTLQIPIVLPMCDGKNCACHLMMFRYSAKNIEDGYDGSRSAIELVWESCHVHVVHFMVQHARQHTIYNCDSSNYKKVWFLVEEISCQCVIFSYKRRNSFKLINLVQWNKPRNSSCIKEVWMQSLINWFVKKN